MSTPIAVLLGFAAWTLLLLFGSVGIYRWSRVLTGRASVHEWRADMPEQGCAWYQRAMRAHMNCIENLPVYAAVVLAAYVSGVESRALDRLALALLAARIAQSLVHVTLEQTEAVAKWRFGLYFSQVVCMMTMGGLVALHA